MRNFDTQLGQLKKQLIHMAGLVEKAIEIAVSAAKSKDLSALTRVREIEDTVNQTHLDVDASSIKLLALQQPLAKDLRFVIAVTKINNDLERMVDLAVNITQNTKHLLEKETSTSLNLDTLWNMATETRGMLREAIDAFVRSDLQFAHHVLERDDKVDASLKEIMQKMLLFMNENPKYLGQGLSVIFMAKNLERIADHATNVAEDVIYSLTGKDVRHKHLAAV